MKSKLRFLKQETPYSCAVACIRMLLDHFGLRISEAKLRQKCGTTVLGTSAADIANCIREFGFNVSTSLLSVQEIRILTKQSIFPIVYVNIFPMDRVYTIHAVIVESFKNSDVIIMDPIKGRRRISISVFESSWYMCHGLAIVATKLTKVEGTSS